MAQSVSSNPQIITTSGKVVKNDPVLPNNVVRTTTGTALSGDHCDSNRYPVLILEIVTGATQYWFYNIGEEALRDSDLATFC
jgi:hypothetical protein